MYLNITEGEVQFLVELLEEIQTLKEEVVNPMIFPDSELEEGLEILVTLQPAGDKE